MGLLNSRVEILNSLFSTVGENPNFIPTFDLETWKTEIALVLYQG